MRLSFYERRSHKKKIEVEVEGAKPMAVTKSLTRAVPYIKSSKVEKWDLEYNYENDNKGDPTYYRHIFSMSVDSVDSEGNVVFASKPKGSWTKAQIVALCPVSHWNTVFDSQVASVITNPALAPIADMGFIIPS